MTSIGADTVCAGWLTRVAVTVTTAKLGADSLKRSAAGPVFWARQSGPAASIATVAHAAKPNRSAQFRSPFEASRLSITILPVRPAGGHGSVIGFPAKRHECKRAAPLIARAACPGI